MECPNPQCHENIIKEIGDMKRCVDKKISWKSLGTTIGLILVLALAVMGAWSKASDERKKNEKDIEVIARTANERFKSIEKSLEKLDKKFDPEKLIHQIKDAIKDTQRHRERR